MENGFGIASMILGIIANAILWTIGILSYIPAVVYGEPMVIIFSVTIGIIVLIIAVLGDIMGIVAITGDDKKVFAIVGLVLCSVAVIFTVILMSIGLVRFIRYWSP
ncbi:MAG: hypothetical protein ACQERB_02105 [Promethearchaeati archaeon]